jgi:DNA adenine methylase
MDGPLSGGFSLESSKKRFTPSSINRIENLDLSNIEFYNEDFVYFLDRKFTKNCLIFLDPPYYLEKGSKLYGEKGDLHTNFDHEKLFQIISKKKNWIITYNDCLFIRQLYRNFKIIPVNWSYGMNISKKSSEIVIICSENKGGMKDIISKYVSNLIKGYFDIIIKKFSLEEEELRQIYERALYKDK